MVSRINQNARPSSMTEDVITFILHKCYLKLLKATMNIISNSSTKRINIIVKNVSIFSDISDNYRRLYIISNHLSINSQ